MPISVHIPKELLANVDRRARKLGLSRSSYVARALEHELAAAEQWSKGFIEHFRGVEPGDVEAVDEMLTAIVKNRTRKGPPKL